MAQDGSRWFHRAGLPLIAMVLGQLCREVTQEDKVAKPDVMDLPHRVHDRRSSPIETARGN